MGSVDTLLAHKGGRLKKGDNFPDQNVVDLIVALAKTYGLKVDCSQMHEPVPIASDVTTAGGRTIVRGHKTRALFVQNLIRCRRLRDRYFDGDLFADPAWDMLLDLYLAAERNTRPVSISSLCIASAVPATTALRWIKTFEDLQLISRRADPSDGRRIFIQLVSETKRQMDELIEAWMAKE